MQLRLTPRPRQTYNFSAGVQRDIGFKTVMEVSYVGSLSRHLGERRNINAFLILSKFVDCATAATFGVTCHPENRDPFSATGAKNSDFLRLIGASATSTW